MPSKSFMQQVLNSPEAQAARGEAPEVEIEDDAPNSAVVEQEVEEEIPDLAGDDEESDEESPPEDESADDEAEEDEQLPGDEEGESDEALESAEGQADDELIFGRYRTMEEAERGLEETRRAFYEKSQALAEAERERQEYAQKLAVYEVLQQQQGGQQDFDTWADEWIENDPEGGMREAIALSAQNDDASYALEYAKRWGQVDPYTASTARNDAINYLNNVARQEQQEQQSAPQPENPADLAAAQAYGEAILEHPDLNDKEMLGEIQKLFLNTPSLLKGWTSGDPAWAKQALLDARKISTSSRGPRKLRKSDVERVAREKRAATVATGDGAPERRPSSPDLTVEEQSILAGADMIGLKRRDQ